MLTAVPVVLAVGYGGLLPEDLWGDIIKGLMTTEKQISITGGKEQKGIILTYVTLLAKRFHSYLWTDGDPIGVKKEALSKDCWDNTMTNICPNMFIRTAICRQETANRVAHHKYYHTILQQAMQ